ncbi:MAG TPA: outer membrane protein transport protein [Polyangiaceae bacterium]
MLNTKRALVCAWAAACALGAPALAHAGGYDTPMLYTARHMGMGGAAIGYVSDPSALFHNPAGLGQIKRGEVIGDFSLLLGGIHSSPNRGTGKDVDSDLTVAPFFLAGAGYRIQDMIVLGVGVYPIASAGATYHYGAPGFEDHTELFFLETSPAISLNPLPNLRFGLGYRFTYVRLVRYQGNRDSADTPNIDFTMTGGNYSGFRGGVQWDALPWLHFGGVYRNKVTTRVSGSQGIALGTLYTDISTHFTLPAKLGFGARADFDDFGARLGVAVDFEYDFNSQNKSDPLRGTPPAGSGLASTVSNVFDWKDSQTVRVGVEYRLLHDASSGIDHLPLRVGFVHDTVTANPLYPTPFGTPPGPTEVVTLGTGYNAGAWQANVAYAYRFGHGAVTKPDTENCAFCGYAGKDDYSIHLSGAYLDASLKF